jgi:hypothetical protein
MNILLVLSNHILGGRKVNKTYREIWSTLIEAYQSLS